MEELANRENFDIVSNTKLFESFQLENFKPAVENPTVHMEALLFIWKKLLHHLLGKTMISEEYEVDCTAAEVKVGNFVYVVYSMRK